MAQRIAYITGGMGGTGTAICQRLSKGSFKLIASCGLNSPRKDHWIAEQKALGYEFIASEGNVLDWESAKVAFEKVKAEMGRIDVLVNNAGITRDGVFRKMSPEDWKAVIDTNLNSLFNVTKQVIDGMIDNGWGGLLISPRSMVRRAGLVRLTIPLLRQACTASPWRVLKRSPARA